MSIKGLTTFNVPNRLDSDDVLVDDMHRYATAACTAWSLAFVEYEKTLDFILEFKF